MLQRSQPPGAIEISGPDHDCQRSLPRRRQPASRIQVFRDLLGPSESVDPGCRQNDGIEIPLFQLSDPGVHVAADVAHLDVGPHAPQQCSATERARSDPSPSGETVEGDSFPAAPDQDVSSVFPFRDGADRDPLGKLSGQVLQGMDG